MPPRSEPAPQVVASQSPVVRAKYANHVWHVDLTTVPIASGFWTTWLPKSFPQCWPFCWWVAVVVDHFSRRVMGMATFSKQPTSQAMREFLGLRDPPLDGSTQASDLRQRPAIVVRAVQALVSPSRYPRAVRRRGPARQHRGGGTVHPHVQAALRPMAFGAAAAAPLRTSTPRLCRLVQRLSAAHVAGWSDTQRGLRTALSRGPPSTL